MFPCIDYFFLRLHCKKESFDILKIAISGSCCSVFDLGIGRVVEDYNSPCAECPFVYQSNDFLNSKLFFFHETSVDNFQLNHCRIYEFHIFFPQGSTCVKPKTKTYSTELNFNGTARFPKSAGCKHKREDCSENARYK